MDCQCEFLHYFLCVCLLMCMWDRKLLFNLLSSPTGFMLSFLTSLNMLEQLMTHTRPLGQCATVQLWEFGGHTSSPKAQCQMESKELDSDRDSGKGSENTSN